MDNLFLDPVRLVQMMRGRVPPTPITRIDCDELTAFTLSFALFIDLPAEIVTIAADPTRPNQFSHVYLRLFTREGVAIPFDLTLGPYPGSELLRVFRRQRWPVNTPVHPWEVSEADQSTAELVSVMIARAKAAASRPEFHSFLRQVVQYLVAVLAGIVSHEEWRRSEAGQEFLRSAGAGQSATDSPLAPLSEEDFQALRAWMAGWKEQIQQEAFDVRELCDSQLPISIPGPTDAEGVRTLMKTVVTALENLPTPLPPSRHEDS